MLPFQFLEKQPVVNAFLFYRPDKRAVFLTQRGTNGPDFGLSPLHMGIAPHVHVDAFQNTLWSQIFYDLLQILRILYAGQAYKQLTVRQETGDVRLHGAFRDMQCVAAEISYHMDVAGDSRAVFIILFAV